MTGCGVAISIGMMPRPARSRPSPVRDLRHASRCSARTSLRLTTRKKTQQPAISTTSVALEANPHARAPSMASCCFVLLACVSPLVPSCSAPWRVAAVSSARDSGAMPSPYRRYDQIPVDVKGAFVDDVIPAPLSGTFASLPLPDFLQVLPSTRTLACHPAGPVTRRACALTLTLAHSVHALLSARRC